MRAFFCRYFYFKFAGLKVLMNRILILLIFICSHLTIQAQIVTGNRELNVIQDSLKDFGKREPANDSLQIHTPVIADYTFWREFDTQKTIIDTVLHIQSLYNQNFSEKDAFGKMPFPNVGQTFNPLVYREEPFRLELLPAGKSFNYLYPKDIRYYDVKTPMTEFIFNNGVKEGQYLSTTFAHNLNKFWNYSVRYRGLRSQGLYKNSLAVNNAFVATLSHHSKNERLKFWSHYASQRIDNRENAGIRDLNQFVLDDSLRTTNRQNIDVNLNNAISNYSSRRFHLGLSYGLFGGNKNDSVEIKRPVLLKNVFTYEKQKYSYSESQAENYYESPVFPELNRANQKNLEILRNTSSVEFNWNERILLEAGLRYENLKLYSDTAFVQSLVNIPEGMEDNLLGVVGRLYFDWNEKIKLTANAEFKSGKIFQNQYFLNPELDIQPIEGYHIAGGALLTSSFPSLNLFYNQSFYKDFNYYNFSFENVNTRKLYGKLDLEKLATKVQASVYNIENYVFVGSDFRPKQMDNNISLFQVMIDHQIRYRHFHLQTMAQYQKVFENPAYLPLPEFFGRVSLFWQDKVFDQKAELQIGFTASYFTKFKSREFFPVLNEFMIQRDNPEFGIQEIGGFPMLDFFFNIKVDRMRIYLEAEHFNALWSQRNYYSAPFVPFRDFKIQIGVKWYLFT